MYSSVPAEISCSVDISLCSITRRIFLAQTIGQLDNEPDEKQARLHALQDQVCEPLQLPRCEEDNFCRVQYVADDGDDEDEDDVRHECSFAVYRYVCAGDEEYEYH